MRHFTPRNALALGRLKAGTMNKMESAYADHLRLRQAAGEVAWFKFGGLKLRLATRRSIRPTSL